MMNYLFSVGINYPGTSAELKGCVNDSIDISNRFRDQLDDYNAIGDGNCTKEVIMEVLEEFVFKLGYRDTLIFHYSGHGTWVPDMNGDEPDNRDECLCPIDFEDNLIKDDELSEIFEKRKHGSRIVFLSDSCHSGSVFRLVGDPRSQTEKRIKFIPPERILGGKYLKTAKKIEENFLIRDTMSRASNEAQSGVVHFSGCEDHEYSYDATFNGRSNGAFTYYFLQALETLGLNATFKDIYVEMSKSIPSFDYPQRPKLNATSSNKKMKLFS